MISLPRVTELRKSYELALADVRANEDATQQQIQKAQYLYDYVDFLWEWLYYHKKDTSSIGYNQFLDGLMNLRRELWSLNADVPPELIPDSPSPDSRAAYEADKEGLITVDPLWAEQNPDIVKKMGRFFYRKPDFSRFSDYE